MKLQIVCFLALTHYVFMCMQAVVKNGLGRFSNEERNNVFVCVCVYLRESRKPPAAQCVSLPPAVQSFIKDHRLTWS